MLVTGKLHAESPIYRGNARKTLFTRDGSGKQRLVSLAGEVSGTAEALMDAFFGASRNGRNLGLLERLWQRLYSQPMPPTLIRHVQCELRDECYSPDHFFDLRMGLKLDKDRWASEANANYKLETLFRHSVFDFRMDVDDKSLRGETEANLYYLLQELEKGRFWFGAGKSKGLGRCRLNLETSLPTPNALPKVNSKANHLTFQLAFNTLNPVLVGWNWGKIEPDVPAFAAVEGRLLLEGMRTLPQAIRERLSLSIGGPILNEDNWTQKFSDFLPRALAAYLREGSGPATAEAWMFPQAAINKLAKAKKHALSKKVVEAMQPLLEHPYASKADAETAFQNALGEADAKKNKRVLNVLERRAQQVTPSFPQQRWQALAEDLGLQVTLAQDLAAAMDDSAAFEAILATACASLLPDFEQQIKRQISLLQSDTWIDAELENRQDHLRIKQMLQAGEIDELQWGDLNAVPDGVREENWREFISAHRRVQYRHMLNAKNLNKSITNDENMIAYLQAHRNKARQELVQPQHIDFRGGGEGQRDFSRQYGKPYDKIFMRMLSWAPSDQGPGLWEIYIPGSTLKGGFRKRAEQILITLWGESARTAQMLDLLFGAQRQAGLLLFSDAYLADPQTPQRAWCSMDGVRMDPKSGRPLEEAKTDCLYAYGRDLIFQFRIDLQDLSVADLEALSILNALLRDFHAGDIPLGGEKSSGFGWVEGHIEALEWLHGGDAQLHKRLFGDHMPCQPAGIWQQLSIQGASAQTALDHLDGIEAVRRDHHAPPMHQSGRISHREYGGYCGTLEVEVEVLTALSIQESGEPSYSTQVNGQRINGWDLFSLTPPAAQQRPASRQYALPSKSLKGMVRHLYAIVSDSATTSTDLEHLNPVDQLFGWVGQGPNQALMGRLAFHLCPFDQAELAWFKVPYPYGEWQFDRGGWKRIPNAKVHPKQIAQRWRLYANTPLAPCVTRMDDFTPDSVQADYRRALLPGSRGRFRIRFWNLTQEELGRLLWCIELEPGLAHKIGKGRQLGFGSLRLHVLPDSFLIDWVARYAGKPESVWRLPVEPAQFRDSKRIAHAAELKQVLNADAL